jgi:hypothetical protein
LNRAKPLLIAALTFNLLQASCVTYEFSGGRLGDNLLSYIHALWISYKYAIPLLYRPFEYSDKLQLHLHHTNLDTLTLESIDQIVNFSGLLGKYNDLPITDIPKTLYVIPYFPHCDSDIRNRFHFDIDWNDKKFMALVRSALAPRIPIEKLMVPKNYHLVALHVRTGEGYDKMLQKNVLPRGPREIPESHRLKNYLRRSEKGVPVSTTLKYADQSFPLKFASDSYYVNQIIKLSELLNDEPLYVHIFTDSSCPEKIAELYTKLVNKPNITFGYRKQGNQHNAYVLEDFYALQECDYLIRGESNFSIVAGFMKDYKISIFPKTCSWTSDTLTIDQVEIQYRKDTCHLEKSDSKRS